MAFLMPDSERSREDTRVATSPPYVTVMKLQIRTNGTRHTRWKVTFIPQAASGTRVGMLR